MIHIAPLVDDDLVAACAALSVDRSAASLSLARKARRMFRLVPPDAPDLYCVGAQFNPEAFGHRSGLPALSATGKGTDLASAVQSCLGEGAELLSQLASGEEDVIWGTIGDAAGKLGDVTSAAFMALLEPVEARVRLRWITAHRLGDGASVRVPAALCLRHLDPQEPVMPRVKLSSGCGAGPTEDAALRHGLLELVERDAIALWWLGGRAPRPVPAGGADRALALLAALRRGADSRKTWLLDITNDLGIPSIAALSTDQNGRGLCGGFAAGLTYQAAAHAAVLELCQIELGLHVIALKVEQDGEASLGESDRKHWRRALGFDARTCGALQAAGADAVPPAPRLDSTAGLADRLATHGIDAFCVDHWRPFLGIPVTQALAPQLQPIPSNVVTARLARQINSTGGGFGLTNAVELI